MNEDANPEPEQRKPVTELPPPVEPGKASAKAQPFIVFAKDMGLKPGYSLDRVWESLIPIPGLRVEFPLQ